MQDFIVELSYGKRNWREEVQINPTSQLTNQTLPVTDKNVSIYRFLSLNNLKLRQLIRHS